MLRKFCLVFVCVVCWLVNMKAQINYGTTGLMNMPTADMQRDKTVMAGTNWLNHHATVPGGFMTHGTITSTSLFFLGWKPVTCVQVIKRYL